MRNKRPKPTCEICILAGGKSQRMGRDKASLPFAGTTLLDYIHRRALGAGHPVRVIREDIVEHCGPLSGIYTALTTTTADAVVFLSCDMPFIDRYEILRLIISLGAHRRAVFSSHTGMVEFPFVLRKTCAGIVKKQIAAGQFSLQDLVRPVNGRHSYRDGENSQRYLNINTPKDLQLAEKLLRKKGPNFGDPYLEATSRPGLS